MAACVSHQMPHSDASSSLSARGFHLAINDMPQPAGHTLEGGAGIGANEAGVRDDDGVHDTRQHESPLRLRVGQPVGLS